MPSEHPLPTLEHRGRVGVLLQIEGAAVLVLGIYLWTRLDLGWLVFVGLFLIPDVFIAGYLAGARIGALTYNLVHTYVGPLVLAGALLASGAESAVMAGVVYVWFAHIGLDRMIGAGLKYPTAFKHTHLSAPSVLVGEKG